MDKKYGAKKILNMVIFGLAVTIFITLLITFLTSDIKDVGQAMADINIKYLLIACALLAGYAIISPIPLCILTRSKKCDISMTKTYLIGSTEHFFNGITPFATGGQPFQVYAYSRLGIKASQSTGILMMNFIIFMCVTNLFALVSLFYYPQLSDGVDNLLVMIIIGFSINFSVLFFLLTVATSKKFTAMLERLIVSLSKKKKLSKFITPRIPAFSDYCNQAQTAFSDIAKNIWVTASCFALKVVSMTMYYAMTFYILKAFNIDIGYDQFAFVLFSTSFAITMSVFIPTPGGSGGIEFAFKAILVAIAVGASDSVITGGMLVWRILSYYIMMLCSFFTYLILEAMTKKHEKSQLELLPIEVVASEDITVSIEPDVESDNDIILNTSESNEYTQNIDVKEVSE